MSQTAAQKREYYRKNRDAVLEGNRRWRKNNPEKAKVCARRLQYEQPGQWLIRRVAVAARQRNIKCTITREQLEDILKPMVCAVTGMPLSFSPYDGNPATRHPWKPSFDRVDNTKGYAPGNVQLVCWAYNLAKASWDAEVVRTWVNSMWRRGSLDRASR